MDIPPTVSTYRTPENSPNRLSISIPRISATRRSSMGSYFKYRPISPDYDLGGMYSSGRLIQRIMERQITMSEMEGQLEEFAKLAYQKTLLRSISDTSSPVTSPIVDPSVEQIVVRFTYSSDEDTEDEVYFDNPGDSNALVNFHFFI